jgi:hypothetical protein
VTDENGIGDLAGAVVDIGLADGVGMARNRLGRCERGRVRRQLDVGPEARRGAIEAQATAPAPSECGRLNIRENRPAETRPSITISSTKP